VVGGRISDSGSIVDHLYSTAFYCRGLKPPQPIRSLALLVRTSLALARGRSRSRFAPTAAVRSRCGRGGRSRSSTRASLSVTRGEDAGKTIAGRCGSSKVSGTPRCCLGLLKRCWLCLF